jgi:predicted transcriptional regulator
VNVKLLIDAIVQQTTVLIAQLSTAAGIRAPLAHVADQVFVELSRELEAQGLGRKVVADMFGMALRGYQKRVQRLTESVTMRDRSLWEVVLEHVRAQEHVTRRQVFERFARDSEAAVAAVLHDLVTSGLVYASGQGRATLYRATAENALRALADEGALDSLTAMACTMVFHAPGIGLRELGERLSSDEASVRRAVEQAIGDGRLSARDREKLDQLYAAELLIPVEAESGWEAAVFDHFQAMAAALGAKLRGGAPRSGHGDVIGGTTLTFDLGPGHPLEAEVLGLLVKVRGDLNALWQRVLEHNAQHPPAEDERVRVRFYFGQNVLAAEGEPAKLTATGDAA